MVTTEEQPIRELVIAPASKMKVRAAKWLYDRRIPAGAITLLAGREGIGKSTVTADLVARVTKGRLVGRFAGTPRGVIIVATEDSWNEVILPRLIAAGADLELVFRVEAREADGRYETVSVPKDLEQLTVHCAAYSIALVVVDPIMSVIDGRLDTHRDREVREALDPLARFTAAHTVAVLGLIHVNKSGTDDPVNSVMGSRAFTAVARSVLYCVADPEAEDGDVFLFGHVKSNLGPKQPTIGYTIIEHKVDVAEPDPGDEAVIVTSRVKWGEADERSIRDVMEAPRGAQKEKDGELSNDVAFVIHKMHQHGDRDTVLTSEIAEAFPDVKPNTLNSTLSRLVKRGRLDRIMHGHYVSLDPCTRSCDPAHASSARSASSDTNGSQPSLPVNENCTPLTSCTYDVSREVQERVQERNGWPTDTQGYEAQS